MSFTSAENIMKYYAVKKS